MDLAPQDEYTGYLQTRTKHCNPKQTAVRNSWRVQQVSRGFTLLRENQRSGNSGHQGMLSPVGEQHIRLGSSGEINYKIKD